MVTMLPVMASLAGRTEPREPGWSFHPLGKVTLTFKPEGDFKSVVVPAGMFLHCGWKWEFPDVAHILSKYRKKKGDKQNVNQLIAMKTFSRVTRP